MNPYHVLGVPAEADDATIRAAYLKGVKEYPPDLHPTQFQAISSAYDRIRDEPARLNYFLFNKDCPGDSPLDVLRRYATARPVPPPSLETLKTWLRECLTH